MLVRRELFDIIKIKELKSFTEVLSSVGQGATDGCELCKPIVASILSGLWNDHALKAGRDQIQDRTAHVQAYQGHAR